MKRAILIALSDISSIKSVQVLLKLLDEGLASPSNNLHIYPDWKDAINGVDIITNGKQHIVSSEDYNEAERKAIKKTIEKYWDIYKNNDNYAYVFAEKLGRDGDMESWQILLNSLSENPNNKNIKLSVFLAMDRVITFDTDAIDNFIEIFKTHPVQEVRYASGIALSKLLNHNDYLLKIDNALLEWLSKTNDTEMAKKIISNRFSVIGISSNFAEKLKTMHFERSEIKELALDLIKRHTPTTYYKQY